MIAIILSCFGIIGLTAFAITKRTREICIRKVFGASPGKLYSLITRQFIIIILIANITAWPVSWFVLHYWLQNFVYHINPGWQVFIFSGGITLIILLITISFQTLKAIKLNPVNALKYE